VFAASCRAEEGKRRKRCQRHSRVQVSPRIEEGTADVTYFTPKALSIAIASAVLALLHREC
jgi:hypothetical protein